MTDPEAEPLAGGMMNSPKRIGGVVHRVATEATETIHALLAHVRSRGITWVPEPLGVADGHEMLTFLLGEVPHDMPAWIWKETTLRDVAAKLRKWHDATVDFPTEQRRWNLDTGTPHEVICHNDFAPYNCVFEGERMTGLIDFDLCAPGSRLWDMAYTAYRYIPVMPSKPIHEHDDTSPFGLPELRRRLCLFLDAYAMEQPKMRFTERALLDTMRTRLEAIATWTRDYTHRTSNVTLHRNARMYASHAAWIKDEFRPSPPQE